MPAPTASVRRFGETLMIEFAKGTFVLAGDFDGTNALCVPDEFGADTYSLELNIADPAAAEQVMEADNKLSEATTTNHKTWVPGSILNAAVFEYGQTPLSYESIHPSMLRVRLDKKTQYRRQVGSGTKTMSKITKTDVHPGQSVIVEIQIKDLTIFDGRVRPRVIAKTVIVLDQAAAPSETDTRLGLTTA